MAEKFQFQYVADRTFPGFSSKAVKELLIKWGMFDHMKLQMFTYNKHFQEYQRNDFVMDFMTDPNVQSNLQVLFKSGTWAPVGVIKVSKLLVNPVPCSVVNMGFFDKLFKPGLVRDSGMICKCLDEYVDGFNVSDELRKMHLMEESDHFDTFSDTEKMEFIFRLFKHLCLGGDVCQFEDDVNPYLKTTKAIYKDLVSVYKDSDTKELKTRSHVFQISALDNNDEMIYPRDKKHDQSFAYLVLDPLKRNVLVLYHQWLGIAW